LKESSNIGMLGKTAIADDNGSTVDATINNKDTFIHVELGGWNDTRAHEDCEARLDQDVYLRWEGANMRDFYAAKEVRHAKDLEKYVL
jgi:hypothetical protein